MAAVVSFRHMHELCLRHGEDHLTGSEYRKPRARSRPAARPRAEGPDALTAGHAQWGSR
ncbi:hypothetical protein [Streptosporangium sp. NPDC020145]|uniref:hypothetical protein n=1 Tax=Streptosporangium sp. NPDC020145 TaxID=3154694 RepID=UPI003438B943